MFHGKWLKKIKRLSPHKCNLPDIDNYDEGSAWLCRKCKQIHIVTAVPFMTSNNKTIKKYKWKDYEDMV